MQDALPRTPPKDDKPTLVHATTIAVKGQALLIMGPSGIGKSSLALEMMALGASLIADDQTVLRLKGDQISASCPPAIAGRIEARGLGLLLATPAGPSPLCAVLDLATLEYDRLPPFRETILLGRPLPLLHKAETPAFPAALLQYLKAGRRD